MNFLHSEPVRTYPPFDALIAFEAVLRHRSVTSAALELGVTQSAVSHRLRRLQAFVGAALLRRTSLGLEATPAGLALAEGLDELLAGLADLRARCRRAVKPDALRVGVAAALADLWLVRRLPRFLRMHPAIAVELVLSEGARRQRDQDVDIQILWLPSGTVRASSTQSMLFQEQVFPVCHPKFLPRGALSDPAALANLPLLHKGPADGGGGAEWSWHVWFERLGLAGGPSPGLRFGTIGTAIAAALNGAGVVLARSLLVNDSLTEGRLVRVLPSRWDMTSSKAHLARWPAALRSDGRVRTFVDWLRAEAEATVAAALPAASSSIASS